MPQLLASHLWKRLSDTPRSVFHFAPLNTITMAIKITHHAQLHTRMQKEPSFPVGLVSHPGICCTDTVGLVEN